MSVLRLAISLAVSVPVAGAAQGTSLRSPGQTQSRILSGARQYWKIQAESGQFVRIAFKQSEADLSITVFGPDGKSIGEFDFSQFGPEPVSFVAHSTGSFTFEVHAKQTLVPLAQYSIDIDPLHLPSTADQVRTHAEELVSAARLNMRKGTIESVSKGLAEVQQGIRLWDELADYRMGAYSRLVAGNLCGLQGKIDTSIQEYSKAFKLAQNTTDARLLGEALNNEAMAHLTQGNIPIARIQFDRALEIWEADRFEFGALVVLNNRALLRLQTGQWDAALQDYRNLLLKPGGRENSLRAAFLNNIGLTYLAMGDYVQAESWFPQAARIWQTTNDVPNRGRALTNLGRAYMLSLKAESAAPVLEQAIVLLRKTSDRQALAEAFNNFGQTLLALGRLSKVEDVLQQAVEAYRSVGDRRGTASALFHLGVLCHRQGRLIAGTELLRESLDLRRSLGLLDEEAISLHAMAAVEAGQGALKEAASHLEQAIALAETLRGSLTAPRYRMTFLGMRHQFYEALTAIYIDQQRIEEALSVAERGRARSWLEELQPRQLSPELLRRRRDLVDKLNYRLDQLVRLSSQPESDAFQSRRHETELLVSEYRELDLEAERSAREYPGYAEPKPLTASEMQQVVSGNDVLLYYAVGERNTNLFVVAGNRIQVFPLPGRTELTRLCRDVRDLLPSYRRRQFDGALERKFEQSLHRLSDTLLGPVRSVFIGKMQVLVSADDILQYISFAALTPPGEVIPLGVSREVVDVPSISVLAELKKKLHGRPAAPRSVVVFADPVFDSGDRRAGAEQSKSNPLLPRLSYAGEEARIIQAIAPKHDVWVATGLGASVNALQQADLAQFRVVHFATHALIDDTHPELSGITLSLVGSNGRARQGFISANALALAP